VCASVSAPPVALSVSNVPLDALPTGTLPSAYASQVPNPRSVAGFVLTSAFVYIEPTGYKAVFTAVIAAVTKVH